jgi:hypothetical protein
MSVAIVPTWLAPEFVGTVLFADAPLAKQS